MKYIVEVSGECSKFYTERYAIISNDEDSAIEIAENLFFEEMNSDNFDVADINYITVLNKEEQND